MISNGRTAHRIRRDKDGLTVLALAVLLAMVPAPSKAQNITLTQVTVQDPQKHPIHSEIVYFLPDEPDNFHPLEVTEPKGVLNLKPPFTCLRGTKLQARPSSDAYDFSKRVFCRPTMKLEVTPVHVTTLLQENLEKALKPGDYKIALLIANELAGVETRDGKGVAGRVAENFAIVYAEKAFSVTNGIDFSHAQDPNFKMVMNSKLQAKVRAYQSQKGLKKTGQLDYKTVSTLARTSAGIVRHFEYQAVGHVPDRL